MNRKLRVLNFSLVLLGILISLHYIMLVKAEPGTSIVIGTTDSVESCLDPARAYDFFDWEIIKSLGSGLVEISSEPVVGPDNIGASLATSWEASSDAKVWTFNLRQGVKFDDGTEFNASHVKYTFDRGIGIADADGPFVGIGYDSLIENVTIAGKYTVEFCLKIPFSPFLSLLACPASCIVDPEYAPIDSIVTYVNGNARGSHPLGLGPYILKNWTRIAGQDYEMNLEANPYYWNSSGGYPRTGNLTIKFYGNSDDLAAAIISGDIDIAYRQLTSEAIDLMRVNPGLRVWEGDGAFIQYLVFQEKYAPFNITKTRQAVGAAINRTAIVHTVFQEKARKLCSLIPTGMFGHMDAFAKLGDPNYTLTRELLSSLGYNETNKLSFKLWYETSGHYPQSPQQAQVLKSSLEASGVISVLLESRDWASYRQARNDEIMEAYIYGWYPDYIDPDDYIQPFLDSSGGSWLHHNYNNTNMDQLIAWARGNTSSPTRNTLYSQIQSIMVDDSPIIPLYQWLVYCVTKPDIEAVYLDITESLRYDHIVPEFPSLAITPLFMIASLAAVILYRKIAAAPRLSAGRKFFYE